jgi:hypothetical protein
MAIPGVAKCKDMEKAGMEYLETLSQALHKVWQTLNALGKKVAGLPNPPEMERLC